LLEIVNYNAPDQFPLDGISLVDVFDNKIEARPKAMGFWHPDVRGISTPSDAWMKEMMKAQNG
jgi:hypothetical protein